MKHIQAVAKAIMETYPDPEAFKAFEQAYIAENMLFASVRVWQAISEEDHEGPHDHHLPEVPHYE